MPFMPKDKQRRHYAKGLFIFAIQNIIIHEFGHILNGHIDLKMETGNSFIYEITNFNEKSELDSQTLEYDADCYAANIGIKTIMESYLIPEILHKDVRFCVDSLDGVSWSFSAYSIFRLLGQGTYDLNKLDNYSHPYPGFRQYWVYSMITTFLEGTEYASLIEDKAKNTYTSIIEFEKTIQIINKSPIQLDFINKVIGFPIQYASTKDGWDHMNKIIVNWNKIRPLLEPYSIGDLAPIRDSSEIKDFLED